MFITFFNLHALFGFTIVLVKPIFPVIDKPFAKVVFRNTEVDPMEYDLRAAKELNMQKRQHHDKNRDKVQERKLLSADDDRLSEKFIFDGSVIQSFFIFISYYLLFVAVLIGLASLFKRETKAKKKKKSKKSRKKDISEDDDSSESNSTGTTNKDSNFESQDQTLSTFNFTKEDYGTSYSYFVPLPDDDEEKSSQKRKKNRARRQKRRKFKKQKRKISEDT